MERHPKPTQPRTLKVPPTPAQPKENGSPAKPSLLSQTAKPAQPTRPAEPTRPAVPAQSTRLAQHAEPTWLAQPAQPARLAYPAQPAEPTWLAQPDLARLAEQLRQLQEENAALKARLAVLETTVRLHAQPAEQAQPAQQAMPDTAEEQDQTEPSRLEAWLRRNPAWLDEACPFKKATGRTWRQIAGNEGDKIPMNGKGPQVPRAYLHSIESWAAANETIRLKAKLALALCGNEAGQ